MNFVNFSNFQRKKRRIKRGPLNPLIVGIGARMAGLIAESNELNIVIAHNGLRGSAREVFIEEFLQPFLPPDIGIGTGEIINHNGKRSKQIDVVLYNKGLIPPFISRNSNIGLFPWECVIVAIEVKSTINASVCDDILLNAHSVQKVVTETSLKGALIGGIEDPADAQYRSAIPYYVFAFSSDQDKKHKEWSRLVKRYQHWIDSERKSVEKQNKIKEDIIAEEKVGNSIDELKKKLTNEQKRSELFPLYREVSERDIHGIYVPNKDSKYRGVVVSHNSATSSRGAYTYCSFDGILKPDDNTQLEAAYFLKMILELYSAMIQVRQGYTIQRYFDKP